ncbi:MAG: IS91 family transposase [Opitutaceae bacterium]|nr:IS91 family transposase [Opitutaceae bacterium]
MIEVADILRQHGAAYRASHTLLPSQERALRDIENCRTEFFGGHVAQCDHCGHLRYAYHSCRNRHCPKCHGEQADAWLERQRSLLLPVPHFLLTFTVPAELRKLAFGHQNDVYGALLRCAAAAVIKLAADPRWLGATPTVLAVLHTWTRAMLYHPHVHLLVSAGGLGAGGQRWMPTRNPAFLIPVRALSVIFRAKLRDALQSAELLDQVPPRAWRQPWVVHCQHAGSGTKVLGYLARYVFRVAITNSRIEVFEHGNVTFRYRDNHTQQVRRVCLSADEFIHRLLHHVLPKGFPKVRHYGLASSANAPEREQARRLLPDTLEPSEPASPSPHAATATPAAECLPLCPLCHQGHLHVTRTLRPRRKFPP